MIGPRQSGKTTFLRHEVGERSDYVTFDDPLEREFVRSDPEGFLNRFAERPVILDEIQYVPELMPYLKMRIDNAPRETGRWLLTGSQQFELFLGLCAARHGQELRKADLARECGLSQPTIGSWIGVLEASFVIGLLPPYFRNYGKRLIKSPKLYFLDSAIVTMLTRQPDADAALAGPMSGALVEGWVVAEAIKAFAIVGRKPDLYYWRSHEYLSNLTG